MKKYIINDTQIFILRHVLEHYQLGDDAAHNLLAGFSAKPGDHDKMSWARKGMSVLDAVEKERVKE